MKTYPLIVAMSVLFVLHYVLVAMPEQRDREAIKSALKATIDGDRGEARVQLTGRANDYFQPVKPRK